MKVDLTKGEIEALISTADQMKDDLEYYKFLGKAKYEKFVQDYETAMKKLADARQPKTLENKKP